MPYALQALVALARHGKVYDRCHDGGRFARAVAKLTVLAVREGRMRGVMPA